MIKHQFHKLKAAGAAVVLLFCNSPLLPAQEGAPAVSDTGGGNGSSVVSADPEGEPGGGGSSTFMGLPGLEYPQVLPAGFMFNFGTGISYDDNIYRVQENKESATSLQASGGLAWSRDQSGISSMALSYNATGATYLELEDQNSFSQSAALSAGLSLPRTQFGLSANYSRREGAQNSGQGGLRRPDFNSGRDDFEDSDDEDPEVDPLTKKENLSLSMNVSRKIAERTAMTAGVSYRQDLFSEDLQSTKRGSGRLGLDYSVTADTSLGLAGVAGYQDTESSAERTYQEVLLTAAHNANEKTQFSGEIGFNFSQYEGEDAVSDDLGLVFGLNYSHQFGAKTLFTLSATRDTGGSAVVRAAAVERTRLTAGLSQQLTQRVSLSLQGGYDLSSYESTRTTESVDREENLWRGSISLGYLLNARSSLSLFYSHRRRDSEPDTLSYDSNQIGLQAGIRF